MLKPQLLLQPHLMPDQSEEESVQDTHQAVVPEVVILAVVKEEVTHQAQ